MKIKGKTIITIKLDGFKTYEGTTLIGPLNGLVGILGGNGSGKTNLMESLEFLFDFNSKNRYLYRIKTIFTRLGSNKELIYAKVGLKIKKNDFSQDFIKILNYSGIIEYFLNTKLVSLRNFFHQASKLNFDKFKTITSILKIKTYDVFFDPNIVYKLVQNFSESKKSLLKIIKTESLIKRLQENYLFYSKKIKFIIIEKKMLQENLKKIKILNLKKTYLEEKHHTRSFYKITWLLDKSWKKLKKIKQNSRNFDEFLINQKNIKQLPEFKNILYQQNNNNFKFYFFNCLKKFFRLNHWILITKKIKILKLFREKNFLNFISKKKIKSLQDLKFFQNFSFNRAIFVLNGYRIELNLDLYNNSEKINFNSKKKSHRETRDFWFYTRFLKIFFEMNINIIFIVKKKINIETFYSTQSLINLISNFKEKKVEFSKKKKENFKNNFKIRSFDKNIRGNILKTFKPLDSSFRLTLQDIFKANRLLILVDTFKIAQECLSYFKNSRNSIIQFYPIRSIRKKEFNSTTKKRKGTSFYFDYDEYDSYIPNLLLKLFIYNSLGLNSKMNEKIPKKISNKTKDSMSLHGKLEKTISIKIGKKNLPYDSLKNSLKGFFNKILNKIEKVELRKNFIFNKKYSFKFFTKILGNEKKKNGIFNFAFEKSHWIIQKNNIFFFKKKFSTLLKLYEFIKIKKKAFKKKAFLKINQKKFNLLKFFKILKYPLTKYQIETKTVSFQDLSSILTQNFSYKIFSFLKNLKTRLKGNMNNIEFREIFEFIKICLGKKKTRETTSLKIFLKSENFLKFQHKYLLKLKDFIKKKKGSLWKGEDLINKISKKIFTLSSFFLKEFPFYLNILFKEKNETVQLCIGKVLIFLESIFTPKNYYFKKDFLKKSKTKHLKIISDTQLILFNQLNFLQKRFNDFKEKMLNNRKNYLFVFQKKNRLKLMSNKKFLNYFEKWSKLVRIIYKNLTATYSNPLGGMIFFNYTQSYGKKKGSIQFSVIPVSQTNNKRGFLSEGEIALVTLSVFTGFNYINYPPLVILDEIDSHLDAFNVKKFFWILKKLGSKKNWNTLVVTQKNEFSFYLSELIGIFRNAKGSRVYSLKF